MAIQVGQRLGLYEILAAIGGGGMGEVYRARDGRLNRDVAVKVLPEVFATDPDRMARFDREARVLGGLNHPNIAAIYGLEEFGAGRVLVMELVEGPTLADRIAKGPIPLDEILPIAKQVAEALEYAHDHGVIHRDLKPANIKVTADGTVKVLDFGLAKVLMDEPVAADPRDSPTLSMAATIPGVILGTAAYMSPEQAKGKPVDRRADIWAFGVVLFEMLTGHGLYSGETAAETLAAVMMKEPALEALPKKTPLAIQNLLRRCLEKNVRLRLQHIGEARILIEGALSSTAPAPEPIVGLRKSRERVAWLVASVLFIAFVTSVTFGALAYFRHPPVDARALRFSVSLPDKWSLAQQLVSGIVPPGPLAISPDGTRLAFVAASEEGTNVLWVRTLDTLIAQQLAGTEGAYLPFWSPDSRFLGFFASGKLKKIDVAGGPPTTLSDATLGGSGAWSRDGVILFTPTPSSAFQKVSASGGTPTAATELGQDETAHVMPVFLSDGRHFLYQALTGRPVRGGRAPVYLASLDSSQRKLLLNLDEANIAYSQGYLLFLRDTTLMAQPFDARRLVLAGDPIPVAEQVQILSSGTPYGVFAASGNGVLAYQTASGAVGSQLVWFDRMGKQIGVLGNLALYTDPVLSPDGKRVSFSVGGIGERDIWLYDITRDLRTRFTFDAADHVTPLWSPDASKLIFAARRKVHLDLFEKSASGAGTEQLLLEDNFDKYPSSWSADGQFLLYRNSRALQNTLFVLPLAGDHKPYPLLQTQFNEVGGQFSPDRRWVAYSSDESGRFEVYVVPFPGPGGPWQVSTDGGTSPRWRHDGMEIFYLAPDNKLMAAAVNSKSVSFEVGAVKPLFETHGSIGPRYSYDMSADGQRFLINTTPEQTASVPITIVFNWTAGLRK